MTFSAGKEDSYLLVYFVGCHLNKGHFRDTKGTKRKKIYCDASHTVVITYNTEFKNFKIIRHLASGCLVKDHYSKARKATLMLIINKNLSIQLKAV